MQDKHILIVEDEAPIRDMLRMALERAEYEVSEAGSVQEARVQIADNRPDLVLLDWMIPGVSGIELARELRGDPLTRELPIIMVTALFFLGACCPGQGRAAPQPAWRRGGTSAVRQPLY